MNLWNIPIATAGSLSLASCPTPDSLEADAAQLRDLGVTVVVSALPTKDENGLGLAREAAVLRREGIDFIRVPIVDFGVPTDGDAVTTALRNLLDRLSDPGEHAAVHCLAARGRSPMLAASLLVMSGEEPDLAWRLVTVARRRPVPETFEQQTWVERLATA